MFMKVFIMIQFMHDQELIKSGIDLDSEVNKYIIQIQTIKWQTFKYIVPIHKILVNLIFLYQWDFWWF